MLPPVLKNKTDGMDRDSAMKRSDKATGTRGPDGKNTTKNGGPFH